MFVRREKVCFLSHNDTRLNKAYCRLTRTTASFFSCSCGACCFKKANLKWKMQKRYKFRENINTKESNDKWHKLLSKTTYLVWYYLWCHNTLFGLTEWSRSEKVLICPSPFHQQFYFWMLRVRDSARDFAHAQCLDTVPSITFTFTGISNINL